MQPLLKIRTVPIKIEAQTKRASWQPVSELAQNTAPRNNGYRPAPIKAPAPKQQVVNYNPQRVNPEVARANSAASQNIQKDSYFQEASKAVDAYNKGVAVGNVASQEFVSNGIGDSDFEPQVSAIASGSGSAPFEYQMDRETYDWNANQKPQLEYIPPSIEYSVTQYPDVIIEYVGEPIYVPASSNPNYVPPPEKK